MVSAIRGFAGSGRGSGFVEGAVGLGSSIFGGSGCFVGGTNGDSYAGFDGGGGSFCGDFEENTWSTIVSILDFGAVEGLSGAVLGVSTSMSKMDRSVPQKLHFFAPGCNGESQMGHSFSPLELGKWQGLLSFLTALYDMPG